MPFHGHLKSNLKWSKITNKNLKTKKFFFLDFSYWSFMKQYENQQHFLNNNFYSIMFSKVDGFNSCISEKIFNQALLDKDIINQRSRYMCGFIDHLGIVCENI